MLSHSGLVTDVALWHRGPHVSDWDFDARGTASI
jgi:hypothetical protein